MSEFNLLKCSRFLNSFELLWNRKKPPLIFTVIVFTISCKTKTIVANVNKCTVTTSGSQRHCATWRPYCRLCVLSAFHYGITRSYHSVPPISYTEVTGGIGVAAGSPVGLTIRVGAQSDPERGLMGEWSKHTRVISLTARVRLIQRPASLLPSRRPHLSRIPIPALASNEKLHRQHVGLRRHRRYAAA